MPFAQGGGLSGDWSGYIKCVGSLCTSAARCLSKTESPRFRPFATCVALPSVHDIIRYKNSFTFFAVPWLCRFRTEKEAEIKRTPTAVKENTVFLLCFRYSFPRHLPTRFFSTSSFLYREITGVAVWRIRLEGSHGCMVVGWELCRKPAFLLALEGV